MWISKMWIKMSDRLPCKSGIFAIKCYNGQIDRVHYNVRSKEFFVDDWIINGWIEYWQEKLI